MVFIKGLIVLKDFFFFFLILDPYCYFLVIAVPKLLHCMILMGFFHLVI